MHWPRELADARWTYVLPSDVWSSALFRPDTSLLFPNGAKWALHEVGAVQQRQP
jgi:hypothetical protein